MTSDMVNRVAEALWQEHKKKAFPDMRDLAIAAIKAMALPTDEMAIASQKFMESEIGSSATLQGCAYIEAIDAALRGNNSE